MTSDTNSINSVWSRAERVVLARIPTPIESCQYQWGAHQLFIKRDDLTDCPMSGNKIRKLEYLVGDALAQNCDTLVTCGGIQSNHARATAIVARRLNLDCVLVLSGEIPETYDGNLMLSKMSGADVRIHPDADGDARAERMHRVADELREQGRRTYVITSGGSDEVGVLGYVRAAGEIVEELTNAAPNVSKIVVPVGSGGTYVGLLLGAKLFGLNAEIIGATVDGTPESWRPKLTEYMDRSVARWQFDVRFDAKDIRLIPAAGKGYALSSDAEIEFIAAFAGSIGVYLDPVYTGKTLYAFDAAVKEGRIKLDGDIMFVHTGGIFGLFPQRELLNQFIS
ncbi:MAG: 1-aminocyclopropane-1-carboxylate deaminase [Phycisphaerae bacterium]|nr:MAG: 1-aminocyclopropane-1-carboxylate deaminase [Phycisphaerae bacterium]